MPKKVLGRGVKKWVGRGTANKQFFILGPRHKSAKYQINNVQDKASVVLKPQFIVFMLPTLKKLEGHIAF